MCRLAILWVEIVLKESANKERCPNRPQNSKSLNHNKSPCSRIGGTEVCRQTWATFLVRKLRKECRRRADFCQADLVDPRGIEPRSHALQASVITIPTQGPMDLEKGLEPLRRSYGLRMLPLTSLQKRD